MSISVKINQVMTQSSWIRKMFEEGMRLKAQYGADQVFDFSIGNPNLPPPSLFKQVLSDVVQNSGDDHGYMPQAGYPEVCRSIAANLSREQGMPVAAEEVLMTCGAAGGLNVILKTLLDSGDEVLVPSPFFVEYRFYAENHGGRLQPVPTNSDFTLDLDAVEKAIGDKTKAVLINSPNNPTGQIYSEASLAALGELLTEKSRSLGRTIYLISDEPYRKIVYDDAVVPNIFKVYPESLIATSYSKTLSLAGERIGYAAVNPYAAFKADIIAGMNLCNRILGFVNAPAIMQKVVARLQEAAVDIAAYQRKRDLLCRGLADAGYEFLTPLGAFYLFPKTPIEDDVKFVSQLQEERILAVPGSGFGSPGHIRISYCVDDQTIERALPGFKRVMAQYRQP